MKILFVYTDIDVKGGAQSFQFGIAVLSAFLKQHGHQIDLHYMYPKYRPRKMIEKIEDFRPKLIGFSSTTPQFKYIKKILDDVPLGKDIFTICGGSHATMEPESLEFISRLDAICRGEGEYALLELVEALENERDITKIKNLWVKKNGRVYQNPCRPLVENLDDLPFADRELFPYQSIINSDFGTALFMFTRGCPYNCSYCSNDALRKVQEGKYVRFRSVGSCIQEIREVIDNYKVKSIYIDDDIFTLNKKFVFEFCEEYRTQIKLPFDINVRVETITRELCKKLKKAGCRRVNMGIESGNPYIRNKVLNRKMSNEQIINAFGIARQAGLKTKSFNMVGVPYETPQRFQDTVKLNAEIKPDSVILNVFDPYPGTKLGVECRKKGWIDFERMKEEFVPRTDTILNLPGFSREQILKCHKKFAYNVYRDQSLIKAIFYRIYYSSYGEWLILILAPFKKILRYLIMGV